MSSETISSDGNGPKHVSPGDIVPRQTDVIIGKGKIWGEHPGNIKFKKLVVSKKTEYAAATTKHHKSNILSSIIGEVKSNNGKFLKEDHSSGKWYELEIHTVREKISQTFRDELHQNYRSSAANKEKRRQLLLKTKHCATEKEEKSGCLGIEDRRSHNNDTNILRNSVKDWDHKTSSPVESMDVFARLASLLPSKVSEDTNPFEPVHINFINRSA